MKTGRINAHIREKGEDAKFVRKKMPRGGKVRLFKSATGVGKTKGAEKFRRHFSQRVLSSSSNNRRNKWPKPGAAVAVLRRQSRNDISGMHNKPLLPLRPVKFAPARVERVF